MKPLFSISLHKYYNRMWKFLGKRMKNYLQINRTICQKRIHLVCVQSKLKNCKCRRPFFPPAIFVIILLFHSNKKCVKWQHRTILNIKINDTTAVHNAFDKWAHELIGLWKKKSTCFKFETPFAYDSIIHFETLCGTVL